MRRFAVRAGCGLIFLLGVASSAEARFQGTEDDAAAVRANVDARVELVSILFRLAGNREYNQARLEPYAALVDEVFRPFSDHPAVGMARDLRSTRGVGFDACMSFALHLEPDISDGALLIESRGALPAKWPDDLDAFLAALTDFATASDFARFFDEHAEFYTECERRLDAVLAEAQMNWFEGFFGTQAPGRFELAIGLLNGGANYGPTVEHPDGSVSFHCVLGAWKADGDGLPLFERDMLSTVVHEFCHSYCNPLVDAHAEQLEDPLSRLWPRVAERMRKQAYGSWNAMGYESLVRASVTRYIADTQGDGPARTHAESEVAHGFEWTIELAHLLGEYSRERGRYPNLASFFPNVVAFFDEYAGTD